MSSRRHPAGRTTPVVPTAALVAVLAVVVALALTVSLAGGPTVLAGGPGDVVLSAASPDDAAGDSEPAGEVWPARAGAVDGGAPRPPRRVALTWSAEYMNDDHEFTAAQARAMARRFDLVAAMPAAFADHVAVMRRANPDLALLSYANATLAEPADVAGLPESAYEHDVEGRRIRALGWGTYLMDADDPAWRAVAVAECDERVRKARYDGCLLDMLTLGVFAEGIVTAPPADPATGEVYDQRVYRDRLVRLGRVFRERSPRLAHVGNSVENAYRYWRSKEATSRPLVLSQPAAQMEDFLRGAGDGAGDFPSAEEWLDNVRVVEDLHRSGTVGLFTTKLWVPATRALAARWQAYAMATFLLGAGGRAYFAFTRSRDQAGVLQRNAPYRMPRSIGAPTGPRARLASGAWARDFARGRAVVNPTGRAVVVRLGRPLVTLDGRLVRSLRLPASSGQVLVVPRPA